MSKLFLILSISCLFFGALHSQEKNQITYLANEGILIEYEGKRVLIDALHKSQKQKIYRFTQIVFRENMVAKVAPFDTIDLFLITNVNDDHFSPPMMIDFLEKHEESILMAPNQVVDTMNAAYLAGQIYRLNGTDQGLVYEMDGIKIHTIPLIHSYPKKNAWIENMGYLLDFNGLTVLHTGDAEFLPENLNRLQKAIGKGVDYILLPDWYFEDEETIAQVKRKIKAKKFMAMHVMVTRPGTYERRLKKRVKDFKMDLNVLMRVGEFQALEK